MDKSLTDHSSPLQGIEGVSLHARLSTERGGQCREDCDYDIEDFAPGSIVIECSHSSIFELDYELYFSGPCFCLQIYCTNFALCEIERDSAR